MKGFMPSRLSHILPVAAMLVAIGLSYGAYLSIPVDSDNFGGLGISARGTITSIDASMRVLNINHEPVKALNSPSMQMNFGVAPNVDLSALRVGSKVAFTLGRREGDLYIIDSIKPTM